MSDKEWDGEDRQVASRGFHFDNTISWGHILTTMTLIISGFIWVSDVEKKIENFRTELGHVKEIQDRDRSDIRDRLTKLDKNIEKLLDEVIYRAK